MFCGVALCQNEYNLMLQYSSTLYPNINEQSLSEAAFCYAELIGGQFNYSHPSVIRSAYI